MTSTDYSSIHRYLDAAFAGVPITAETQDLKEEIRGNLAARVAELQAQGMDAAAAASTAAGELGDIRDLIGELAVAGTAPGSAPGAAAAHQRNKARPRPGFVVRTVLFSMLIAAAVALTVLGLLRLLDWPAAVLAAVVGFIVLGVTQTNRKKPWVLALHQQYQLQDSFTQDQAAAARFTIGFARSRLALLAGVAVFMFVLARMLFPAGPERKHAANEHAPQGR